jgi:hypothetical protein
MLNQANDELVVGLVVKVDEMPVMVVVAAAVVVEEEEYEVFYLMMFELVIFERLDPYVKQ